MKIRIFSRKGIERYLTIPKDLSKELFISINSWTHWDKQYPEISPLSKDSINNKILILWFDDVTAPNTKFGNFVCRAFSQQDAISIKTFLERNKTENIEYINIHCTAGISRSGAVGTVLNEYFNKFITNNERDYEWMYLYGSEQNLIPNPYVMNILRTELGMNYE